MGYEGLVDSKGNRTGMGKQRFKDGACFEGLFQDNQMVEGRIVFANGEYYIGPVYGTGKDASGEYGSKDWSYFG